MKLALLAIVMLLPTAAQAQVAAPCAGTITFGECRAQKLAAAEAALADPTDSEKRELVKKTTGVTTPAEEATSLADFASRFAAALIAPGIDDDFAAFGTSYNLPLGDDVTIKFGLTLKKPEVYEPLLDAVPEQRRDALRERLEEDFQEFDQPVFTVAFNPETRRFGRRFQKHAPEFSGIINPMRNAARARIKNAITSAELNSHLRDMTSGLTTPECTPTDRHATPLSCFSEEQREQLESLMDRFASARAREQVQLAESLRSIGFNLLADLVNNQPQITFDAQYDAVDDAVGPQSFTAKARYESGFANMNKLRKNCGRAITAACMRSYLGTPSVLQELRSGDRIWLSLEYTRQGEYDAPFLPIDSATLHLESGWDWAISGGFGRYLEPGSDGAQSTRVDLNAKYTGRKDDGVRETDQFLLNATLSQKLGDTVVGALGLVWANKGELIGDDFKQFGARFGLKLKVGEAERD
jgi:hypothetical protein